MKEKRLEEIDFEGGELIRGGVVGAAYMRVREAAREEGGASAKFLMQKILRGLYFFAKFGLQ